MKHTAGLFKGMKTLLHSIKDLEFAQSTEKEVSCRQTDSVFSLYPVSETLYLGKFLRN
jgi:hypothetical protein